MNLGKMVLIGGGLAIACPGLVYLVAPHIVLEGADVTLGTVDEYHLVRAAYGGGFLGMAALFWIGAARRAQREASLWALCLLFSGFAIGRLYSIVVDGAPARLFLAVLAGELFFAALSSVALRRLAAGTSAPRRDG